MQINIDWDLIKELQRLYELTDNINCQALILKEIKRKLNKENDKCGIFDCKGTIYK